jgi:hypothetical protein
MTAVRPYIRLGIADLESIFETASTDAAICRALAEELRHRTTDRAAALLERVRRVSQPTRQSQPSAAPSAVRHGAARAAGTSNAAAAAPVRATNRPPAQSTSATASAPSVATAHGDKPASILAAWTALEALSPQTYRHPADLANGDRRCVAAIDGDDLPWVLGERSRPNYRLYYQVVLGSVPLDRATDELINAFGEDDERGRREREKAALAAVLVDRQGLVLEDNAVAISSFGWALPIALMGNLSRLGDWSSAEQGLVEGLTKQLSRTDRDGNPLALDAATLRKAVQWFIGALGLPIGLYEEPSFALRAITTTDRRILPKSNSSIPSSSPISHALRDWWRTVGRVPCSPDTSAWNESSEAPICSTLTR